MLARVVNACAFVRACHVSERAPPTTFKVWRNFRQCMRVPLKTSKKANHAPSMRFECRFCDLHWSFGSPKVEGQDGLKCEYNNPNYNKKKLAKHFNPDAPGSGTFRLCQFDPAAVFPDGANVTPQDREIAFREQIHARPRSL